MRDLPHILGGGKSPEYDARGVWTGPHPAFEGWKPTEPAKPRSSWVLVLAAAALVVFARKMGV
jgi:hypothetical protein